MISKEKFYYLYNKNSPLNKKRDIGPIDARLFLRDLSLPVAYLMAKNKVKPDFITYLFLILSLLANVLFTIPSIWTIVLLIILLEVSQLLDCVDGQLARFYNSTSKHGENLDTIAHILTSFTFMFAFGIRLYFSTNQSIFIFLGLIGALVKALDHYQIITHSTLLDSKFVKAFSSKSKLKRYVMNTFQSLVGEIRIFGMYLLIISVIQVFSHIHLIEYSFFILLAISVVENILLPASGMLKEINIQYMFL